jgi:SagB-type dehydrogenase family enzyme
MLGRPLLAALALFVITTPHSAPGAEPAAAPTASRFVALPKPDVEGGMALTQVLAQRRSVREYAPGPLTLPQVAQLLWAAHGNTGPGGKRTTPSARAVYPLQVWLVANDVTGLPPGIYRYVPADHALAPVSAGDHRAAVAAAASGQKSIESAPVVVAVTGDSVLAAEKFRGRAAAWLGMEAGFVVQDVYLQATALGLGTVMVGGFQDAATRAALGLPDGWVPLALMPVGRKK